MGRKNVLLAWHEQLDWSNWFLSKFKHQYKRAQNEFGRVLIIEATYDDKKFSADLFIQRQQRKR